MQSNTRLGILYMVATTLVFALQDGFSQYLSSTYNVYLVVMIRYWFFAAFVIAITAQDRVIGPPTINDVAQIIANDIGADVIIRFDGVRTTTGQLDGPCAVNKDVLTAAQGPHIQQNRSAGIADVQVQL